MPVRELSPAETHLAYAPMLELRPHLQSVDDFVAQVNDRQRPDGYRLIASFEGDEVASVAGFRRAHYLAWGEFVYIDDLVTLERFRGRGHGRRLLDRVADEARRLGCTEVHLDSATHRHDAHRLYLASGYRISAFHFAVEAEELLATMR
jgi:GNAT superfamily N-acetyltransferase